MKNYNHYIFEKKFNINDLEKLFIEYLHFNELEIKFNFIEYGDELFFIYNKDWCFSYISHHKCLFINRSKLPKLNYVLNNEQLSKLFDLDITNHSLLFGWERAIMSYFH